MTVYKTEDPGSTTFNGLGDAGGVGRARLQRLFNERIPTDSTDSTVIDTNVSTSVPPDTTDPILDIDEDSVQTNSEPEDNESTDNLRLVPDITMASESATDINEETLEPRNFLFRLFSRLWFRSLFLGPLHARAVLRDSSELQTLYEKYFPIQFFGIYSSDSDDNEQDGEPGSSRV